MDTTSTVSIISVVYNDENNIEETLKSVCSQNFKNIQYIVIDGASTDSTKDIINKYKDKIDSFISEEDLGIYDAMNKGLDKAKGEWIYFLNSGDTLATNNTIASIFTTTQDADILYGNHVANYGYFSRTHIAKPKKELNKGMIFSHQGMFTKTKLLKKCKFNTQYKMSADFDFIYSLHKNNYKFKYIDQTIAKLKANGLSEENIIQTHLERWKIIRHYEKGLMRILIDITQATLTAKVAIIKAIKFILPQSLIQSLTQRKYR